VEPGNAEHVPHFLFSFFVFLFSFRRLDSSSTKKRRKPNQKKEETKKEKKETEPEEKKKRRKPKQKKKKKETKKKKKKETRKWRDLTVTRAKRVTKVERVTGAKIPRAILCKWASRSWSTTSARK
jgi:hypothetical protein